MNIPREVVIGVTPVGKPRQTQSDRWKQRPAVMRYRAFADAVRECAAALDFTMPDHGAAITFELPMPQSWSAKKKQRMRGTPHQQTPDLDNLVKALLDALCGEDCTIWQLRRVEKVWGGVGMIWIRTEP